MNEELLMAIKIKAGKTEKSQKNESLSGVSNISWLKK